MNNELITLILCFGCAVATLGLYFAFKQYFTTKKEEKTENSEEEEELVLPLSVYDSIVKLLQEINVLLATISELNVLIEKNAEIRPTLEEASEYTDFEYIKIWKKAYVNQLQLKYVFFKDIYALYRNCLASESRNKFDRFVVEIQDFMLDNRV